MSGIQVRGLHKSYAGAHVVRGVSFDCPAGQITGLVGPNGSGKTTILRLLAGLATGDEGTATFDGRRYVDLDRPGTTVGVLLDASAHHPGRTVYETVRSAGMLMRLDADRARKTIDAMGLSSVSRRLFGALSLGMKQRVGLAVALMGQPEYLVLDEPVNGLDVESLLWLRGLLMSFCQIDGGTVLVSSHLLRELESFADRVVVVSQGRVVAEEALDRASSIDMCEVATDEVGRLRGLLDHQAISWHPTVDGSRTVAAAGSRTIAQLALRHGLLVTELVPGRPRTLEQLYLQVAAGDFRFSESAERMA